jgi:threonine dehydratase
MPRVDEITVQAIEEARTRLAGAALRTPLIPLDVPSAPGQIYLKLENLQPIGSFKIRGASNAMALTDRAALERGVYTASAGNMAQGVAWNAQRLGVPCHVVVPHHAPQTKLEAIARMGAKPIKVPFDEWWQVIIDHSYPGLDGVFIHPVSDPRVIAGNGTIGLEILEDLPDVDAVVVPFGGGGLSSGIATALRARKPGVRVFAAEVETAAPLAASLGAGHPERIEYIASFVDGIGASSVLEEMWPMVRAVLDDSIVVPVDAVADAVRLLAGHAHVIAEGAGAASVAAALTGCAGSGRIVCVISGGNIDRSVLATILEGHTPTPAFTGH